VWFVKFDSPHSSLPQQEGIHQVGAVVSRIQMCVCVQVAQSYMQTIHHPCLSESFLFLRGQMEEFVMGVQEELGVLDDLRYEWHRLQTFVNWPLETPRPTDLAKAGFYFAPTAEAPDG
jgi:hypothetical protein